MVKSTERSSSEDVSECYAHCCGRFRWGAPHIGPNTDEVQNVYFLLRRGRRPPPIMMKTFGSPYGRENVANGVLQPLPRPRRSCFKFGAWPYQKRGSSKPKLPSVNLSQ